MRKAAFTIIELLVTVMIIGLLLAGAGLSYDTARKNGRDGRRLGDVLLISQAIDQSANLNRGLYPTNVVGGASDKMCARELSNAANDNKLDLSLFTARKIPTDPLPVNLPAKTSGCTGYQDGYTYYSGASGISLAKLQGYTYLLEVGLEREKGSDESLFFTGAQVGQAVVTTPRLQYFLLGKYCGSNC
jgi:prepilin-type N-terminal cleavage/methylation domain-containing protein